MENNINSFSSNKGNETNTISNSNITNDLNDDTQNSFTGLCKLNNHSSKLIYFCKNHNQLCCAECVAKIKGKGNGQHGNCDVCFIEDIKEEKKKNLKDNLKKLDELSKNIESKIKELKNIFEKNNKSKENIKKELQNVFTIIRNKINERENELLLKMDKTFETLYVKEEFIKEGIKLPQKIKDSIQKGISIDKEWNEKQTELNSLLNGCINIENDIKKIDSINEIINKSHNDINSVFKYTEHELNDLLDRIKNFGNLNIVNKLPIVSEKFNINPNPLIITPDFNQTHQKVTMDPCPTKENFKKLYHIIGCGAWSSLRIYADFESFKNQKYEILKLPIKGYGTNWTIFKNCLYYINDNKGKKIAKFNLNTMKEEAFKDLNDISDDHGQWGGYNYVIFISNPQSLYIIYQSIKNKLVIRELNSDSLDIIESWETEAKPKRSYGALFMIGKILFGINSYNMTPTKIIYKYDLDNKKNYDINISFKNIGGYDTSLHYCYGTNQLWTVNNGKFYSYNIDL